MVELADYVAVYVLYPLTEINLTPMIGIIGYLVFIGIAYLFSTHKAKVPWKLVIGGFALQGLLAFVLLRFEVSVACLNVISRIFVKIMGFSLQGAQFVFGDLARNSIATEAKHQLGFVFAFQVLPTILFFSALTAILYYLGVLQRIVYAFAWLMSKTMRISGAESFSAAGNIFLGQTEAPMLIRPFLKNMSASEITCIMTCGMATLAGGVMAAYITLLGGASNAEQVLFTSSLITASVINVPAAIMFSKIIYPETQQIQSQIQIPQNTFGANLLDALYIGTTDGLKLAVNVGAMLITFISVLALVNFGFEKLGSICHLNDIIKQSTGGIFSSLQLTYIFGMLGCPIAYLIGIPWEECLQVGSLLGQKTVFNEFIAYIDLASFKNTGTLSPKSVQIATFALCGFSNFSSIAIQLGGLSLMASNQQGTLARVGFKALLAASLACFSSSIWSGFLYS